MFSDRRFQRVLYKPVFVLLLHPKLWHLSVATNTYLREMCTKRIVWLFGSASWCNNDRANVVVHSSRVTYVVPSPHPHSHRSTMFYICIDVHLSMCVLWFLSLWCYITSNKRISRKKEISTPWSSLLPPSVLPLLWLSPQLPPSAPAVRPWTLSQPLM